MVKHDLDQQSCYDQLNDCLIWLKEHKTKREIAIVASDMEKIVAYYAMFVLPINKEDVMSNS